LCTSTPTKSVCARCTCRICKTSHELKACVELNPQCARVIFFTNVKSDHPLYVHTPAQRRCGCNPSRVVIQLHAGLTGFGSAMSAPYLCILAREILKENSLTLGLGGRNFCPPSLLPLLFSPSQFFIFRFAKCAARKEVVFAPPSQRGKG